MIRYTLHKLRPVQQLRSYRGQVYQPEERAAQSVELSGDMGMRFHCWGRTYETGAMNPTPRSDGQTPEPPGSTKSYTYRGKIYQKETPP